MYRELHDAVRLLPLLVARHATDADSIAVALVTTSVGPSVRATCTASVPVSLRLHCIRRSVAMTCRRAHGHAVTVSIQPLQPQTFPLLAMMMIMMMLSAVHSAGKLLSLQHQPDVLSTQSATHKSTIIKLRAS